MTQSESAVSLYELYENCDPELLRRTRQTVGMDEGVLARMACLSTAQVRQLESGGVGLFYSITIKRQAYKRLMMLLGAEPPTHAPISHAADSEQAFVAPGQGQQKETIDNIVALSSKSDYLEKRPVKDFFLDLQYRLMAHRQLVGSFLFLLLALMVLVLNWRGVLSFSSSPTTPEVKAESAQVNALPPTVPAPTVASSEIAPSVPVQVAATSVAQSAAMPVAQAEVPASAATAAVVKPTAVGGKTCAHVEDKLTEVVSASANKPANYVYVVSPTQTVVCVVDGAKKSTVLELRPNEGRSVYGSPPWQVSGNGLKDAQIFFQGVRVKAPEGHEQQFTLLEKP